MGAALVAALLLAVGMGEGSHFDSDDALYAQMAREMVASGDWVDNRWSGAVVFEKPPLLLWSLATSGALFGWGEGAMRLPVTLFAAWALGALVVLARGLGASDRRALGAAGLMGGSFLFVLMARRPMTDMPLMAMALSAAAAVVTGRWTLSGAFAGLALLAKGPAALPLLCASGGWALWRRPGWRALVRACAAALVVAGPWFALVTLRHGAAPWETWLGYHVASRAGAAIVPGLSVAEVLELLGRERLLLALGAVGLVAGLARREDRPLTAFAALWLALSLGPVLVSQTRLAHYLLPVVPALALSAVALVPERAFAWRPAPWASALVALAAFLAHPAKLSFWLDPDFGPAPAALGRLLAQHAGPADRVVAFNTTTAGLTFYAARPVALVGDDPRFMALMKRVDMNRRVGLVRDLSPGALAPPGPHARRFVVARAEPDLPRVLSLLGREAPERPLWVLRAGALALANDAGLGEPVGQRPR